ncbi:MAG: hypothetical protein B6229_01995 [Spirochaetaceae bacterium 4572_7]|nr:MAG: hypothetical protein B6229_01995 [Spirochaetaceae bacterium 4572_7]
MRRFFCQYCGAEVPLNADICPSCKKEFGEVLCPKCNYTGSSIKFFNGCPKCGYLKNKAKPTLLKKKKERPLSVKKFIVFFILLITILIIFLYLFTH